MPSVDKASKSAKDKTNKDICTMDDVEKEAKSIVKKVLGDISKTSATKQIILGLLLDAMRVGKTAALALGGGIILLQVANEKGYIKINWDKVSKNLDKVADKVEEKVTGQKASWTDKVLNFARNNTPFSSGFVGGFLIGLASH
nr:unnamed protein product [Callosobruchus chinensis]